jgi:hypothetical protein
MIYFNNRADRIAIINPNRYKLISAIPCKLINPLSSCLLGITSAINIVYTGMRAEQLISGVTKIVINRSF